MDAGPAEGETREGTVHFPDQFCPAIGQSYRYLEPRGLYASGVFYCTLPGKSWHSLWLLITWGHGLPHFY
jgi:hypothetical protein